MCVWLQQNIALFSHLVQMNTWVTLKIKHTLSPSDMLPSWRQGSSWAPRRTRRTWGGPRPGLAATRRTPTSGSLQQRRAQTRLQMRGRRRHKGGDARMAYRQKNANTWLTGEAVDARRDRRLVGQIARYAALVRRRRSTNERRVEDEAVLGRVAACLQRSEHIQQDRHSVNTSDNRTQVRREIMIDFGAHV